MKCFQSKYHCYVTQPCKNNNKAFGSHKVLHRNTINTPTVKLNSTGHLLEYAQNAEKYMGIYVQDKIQNLNKWGMAINVWQGQTFGTVNDNSRETFRGDQACEQNPNSTMICMAIVSNFRCKTCKGGARSCIWNHRSLT